MKMSFLHLFSNFNPSFVYISIWKIAQINLIVLSYLQVSDDEDDDEISHDSEEEERELQIEENMSNLKEAVASLGVK